jgi:hypothetical protein
MAGVPRRYTWRRIQRSPLRSETRHFEGMWYHIPQYHAIAVYYFDKERD